MDKSATISIGKKLRPFSESVRVCSKCCRKLDSQGKALRKSVKVAVRDAYGDDVELEKVDCFSLCPKGGQVLSTTGKNGGRRLVIIQPGSDVEMAVDYLLRPQRLSQMLGEEGEAA
jgi:predicted metal-binding protein